MVRASGRTGSSNTCEDTDGIISLYISDSVNYFSNI